MYNLGAERRAELLKEIAEQKQQALNLQKQEEAAKAKEALLQVRVFTSKIEPHYKEGSLVQISAEQVGYLKDITSYGAMFYPLDVDKFQKGKIELYIGIRDSYEQLYRYEAETQEPNDSARMLHNAL